MSAIYSNMCHSKINRYNLIYFHHYFIDAILRSELKNICFGQIIDNVAFIDRSDLWTLFGDANYAK